MSKQFRKQRSKISMLKRIFGRHLNVSNDFADTADNFITFYSLHLAGSIHKNFISFYLFIVCLFVCLCWTRCYYYFYVFFYVLLLYIYTFFHAFFVMNFWFNFIPFTYYYYVYAWYNIMTRFLIFIHLFIEGNWV